MPAISWIRSDSYSNSASLVIVTPPNSLYDVKKKKRGGWWDTKLLLLANTLLKIPDKLCALVDFEKETRTKQAVLGIKSR